MAVVGSGAGMSSFDANRMRCVGTRVAQAAGLAARLHVRRNVQSAPMLDRGCNVVARQGCWPPAPLLLCCLLTPPTHAVVACAARCAPRRSPGRTAPRA